MKFFAKLKESAYILIRKIRN